ncbi:MAG TPA: hypothetical protein VMT76_10460 [Puia sp.]|nr:hypothetical protein [Puia sp.]
MMNVYAENFPQENVYVHFDKNVYNEGETVWYKAYVFAGGFPSLISKNFYTELSDADGNVLQRNAAPLLESTAAGSFTLPKTIKNGHLHFRAYTAWMQNFDTAFVYEKDIRIANGKKDISVTPGKEEVRMQFFPEGGYIIAGVDNNIAFKANDRFGQPVSVKGVIKDITGKELAKFSSEHDGMGSFLLNPGKSDSLVAVWTDNNGTQITTALPQVKNSGAVLRVLPAKGKILFSVARSSENDNGNNQFIIIASMHQHLIYKAKINLRENFMSGGAIPVNQLPSGILQITLFSEEDMPLAERIVFVNNQEYEFAAEAVVTKKNTSKRGENVIEITVPDTLKANLSLSVTDALADGISANEDNIISRLLCTGDIKGYVHNPFYYFSNSSDSVVRHLDLVMLTHGWRRFKWEQLARGKMPVIKYFDQDHLILGVDVFGVNPSSIAKDESLNVILKKRDSSTQILQVPHLSGGKFGLSGLVFYDTAKIYYSFNINRNLSNMAAVTFNNGLIRQNRSIRPLTIAKDSWAAADSSLLNRNRFIIEETQHNTFTNQNVKTLEAVTVRGKTKSPAQLLDEKYTSGLFSGGDGYSFDLVNDPFAQSAIDIFTYLQGKVAGLQINTTGATPSLQWRGSTPGLFLNEMQVDVSALRNIPVTDVAYIKVMRPGEASVLGGSAGGAIAVYTKRGNEGRRNDDNFKGLDRAQIIGYTLTKEFYSPDYRNIDDQTTSEDTRSTLFWKPYILTDKDNRRFTIRFFNNDITKVMRLVMEGVNEDGKLARVEKIIQ